MLDLTDVKGDFSTSHDLTHAEGTSRIDFVCLGEDFDPGGKTKNRKTFCRSMVPEGPRHSDTSRHSRVVMTMIGETREWKILGGL